VFKGRRTSRINIEGDTIVVGAVMKLFIRSSSVSFDLETTKEMSWHTFCDPETATRASEIYGSKLKGRVLSEEHSVALQKVIEYARAQGEKLEVLDVPSANDRIRALRQGVFRTPTLIAHGKPFKGLMEISRLVERTE
jgi:hypothetical protein